MTIVHFPRLLILYYFVLYADTSHRFPFLELVPHCLKSGLQAAFRDAAHNRVSISSKGFICIMLLFPSRFADFRATIMNDIYERYHLTSAES